MTFFQRLVVVMFIVYGANGYSALRWTDEIDVVDAGVPRTFTLQKSQVAVKNQQRRFQIEAVAPQANPQALIVEAARIKVKNPQDVFLLMKEKEGRGVKGGREGVARIVTSFVLVQIDQLDDVPAWEKRLGLTYVRSPEYAPGFHLFKAETSHSGLERSLAARSVPGVRSSNPLLARQQQKRFVPNDTFYASHQWHLNNTGQNGATAGLDVNITKRMGHL